MKRQCNEIRSLRDRFPGPDLLGENRSRVEQHLGDCLACRLEVAAEQAVAEALTDLPELECPAGVTRRIEQATILRPRQTFLARWWSLSPALKPLAVGAAALFLMLLLWPLGQRLSDPGDGRASYSHQEVLAARNQARATLLMVATTMRKTEKKAVGRILGDELPSVIRKAVRPFALRITETRKGGYKG